jgi:pimeloyl-ACP methyl ester carboxylesterase
MHDLALLHGGGQGSWVWSETIGALQSQSKELDGKIMALDVPGCGTKRGRATDTLEPEDVARELIRDLECAGMQNIVLVGHSMGGNLLPALAELRPDLFRRLVYVTCSLPLPGQTVLQMLGGGLHGSSENQVGWPLDPSTTSIRERYIAMFCNDMTQGQQDAFLQRLQHDEWPRSFFTTTRFAFKKSDKVPATYVICLQDHSLPVPWQEKFAERFHAERIIRINAGHQVMITHPHELATVLRHESEMAPDLSRAHA